MAKATPAKKKAAPKKKKAAVTRTNSAPAKKAAKPAQAKDARSVVRERRFEGRRLVTRATFVGFSFDLSYTQIPGSFFVPQLNALIVDQSANGCSLVFLKGNPLTANLRIGVNCLVQIEPDRTLKATLRWVKELDGRLVNAGFEFTEA